MHVHDAPYDSEARPDAVHRLVTGESLEQLKHPCSLLLRDSGAVVFDRLRRPAHVRPEPL